MKSGTLSVAKSTSSAGSQLENEQSRDKATNTLSQGSEKVNGASTATPRAPKADNQQPIGNASPALADRSVSTKLARFVFSPF